MGEPCETAAPAGGHIPHPVGSLGAVVAGLTPSRPVTHSSVGPADGGLDATIHPCDRHGGRDMTRPSLVRPLDHPVGIVKHQPFRQCSLSLLGSPGHSRNPDVQASQPPSQSTHSYRASAGSHPPGRATTGPQWPLSGSAAIHRGRLPGRLCRFEVLLRTPAPDGRPAVYGGMVSPPGPADPAAAAAVIARSDARDARPVDDVRTEVARRSGPLPTPEPKATGDVAATAEPELQRGHES